MKATVAIMALAMIVVAVVVVALSTGDPAPTPTAGRPVPAPVDLAVNGWHHCPCIRVPSGCYTAKHCLLGLPMGARVTLNGTRVYNWTLDPDRDLAHFAAFADPDQEIGAPKDGDTAMWYGVRHGHAIFRDSGGAVGPIYENGRVVVQRQTYDGWCYAKADPAIPSIPALWPDEQEIRRGDSGAGFYVDGVLVGILSLADMTRGCGAWTVRVP